MKLYSPFAISILTAIMLANCKQLSDSTSQTLVALLLEEADSIQAPLKIPEVGQLAALTQRETEAMNVAFQTQTFAGLNTVEARQSQAESFRELLDFVQRPEFEQTLQWTGPIEGVTPGMTLDQLADVYYSTVYSQIESTYSIGELKRLSDEIASNLYTLIDLREKAVLSEQSISENELVYCGMQSKCLWGN